MRRLTLVALTVLLGLCLLGGCRHRAGAGKLEDLFIANRRYVIDKTTDQVHIFGLLQNNGPGRFREIEVVATLLSRNGNSRGDNSVILPDIQPGEKRPFSLEVSSSESVASVDLQVRKPKSP
jgi:hypothetical protein